MNKIVKDVSDFSVDFCENGYVLNYSGRTEEDDYNNTKKVFTNWDACNEYIMDIIALKSEYKIG
jgi:hypothetical protein